MPEGHTRKFARISFLFLGTMALLGAVFAFSGAAEAATGINKQISFQGKVVNSNGTNVANGSYDFTFKLYSVASGGTAIWTETWNSGTTQVTVTDGIFQVNLGTHTSLPGSVDFNTDNIYLGIEFNGDGEMDPRVHFTAAPYAFAADKIHGLTVTDTTGTLTIPNGETISFGGSFTTSASNDVTLTTSGATNVTLPTTGTLATLAGSETLTNKTIGSTGLTFSGAATDITTASGESLVIVAAGAGVVDIQDATTVDSLTTDTGGVSIASGQSYTGAGAVTLTSAAGTALTIDSGTTGAIDIGTASNGKTISIGNSASSTTIVLDKGASGNITLSDFTSCTALETNSSGNLVCGTDDTGAGATAWNAIGDAAATGAVAMNEYAQTLDWNTNDVTAAAFDGLTVTITDDAVTDSNTQRAFVVKNLNDLLTTGTTESLIAIDNADTNEAVGAALSITNTGGGGYTNLLDTPSIDISGAGAITGATGVSSTTGTFTSTIDARGDISDSTGNLTLNDAVDISGALAVSGTSLTATSATTITLGSTGADTIIVGNGGADTITIGNAASTGVSIVDNNWSVTTAGVASFITGTVIGSQTFTTNNIADSGALTIASGTGTALTLNSGTTGAINIGTDASAETINIGNTGAAVKTVLIGNNSQANTITIGDASATNVSITDNNWSIGTGGAASFVSVTSSGAIAANGGITFDNSTDTVGAHTLSGTLDANTNILTNIGNSGTDFIASTGALTLAGVLTANGGISLSASQSLSAAALSYVDLGLITHSTTANQGLRLPNAASATPSNPTSGEGYIAWDSAGNQVIVYNGSAWTTIGGSIADDSLDFDKFQDQLDLDASTDIKAPSGQAYVLSLTNEGTGSSFRVNDAASDTTPFVIDAAGNVGIGIATPASLLETYGSGADVITTLTAADATYDPLLKFRTGSSPAVQFTLGVDNSDSDKFKIYSGDGLGGGDEFVIDSNGVTTIANLNLGATSFDTDAGVISWIDMSVTSGAAINTIESYAAQIDGNSILTVYAESDGAGSIQDRRVQVGSGAGDDTTTALLALDVKTSASGSDDPAGFEGALYYNDNSNTFRCYQNTGWTNCIGSGGSTTWDTIGDAAANGAIAMGTTEQTMDWDFTTTAHDGLTFNFDNNGGTTGTDNGIVINNAVSTNSTGGTDLNTEALLLIQQLDTTAAGTTVVDNGIKIDSAGSSDMIDGIEITNSAGDLTNGINIVDTAGGTLATGLLMSGSITTAIDLTDTNIGTGINMAANDIVGTTGLINYTNFDVDASGNVDLGGTLTAGSANTVLTLSTGMLDADALTLVSAADGRTGTSSASGLATYSDGLSLLQGCSDGQILKWVESTDTWDCAADSSGGSSGITVKVKTADEGLQSATTLQNDNHLSFAVAASENWVFRFNLQTSFQSSTPDIKFGVTAPTSPVSCQWYYDEAETAQAASNTACGTSSAGIPMLVALDPMYVGGALENGATAGSVQLQWAQNTANGSSIYIKRGSSLYAFKVQGADLAEYYTTKDADIKPGDIVSLDPTDDNPINVKKADKPYDRNAIGIVSTQPGMALGDARNFNGDIQLPIALSGRVPIHVNTENGEIRAGDYLTPSSTPGVAMKATKAGVIVAQAMMGHKAAYTESVGTILAFVKTSFHSGSPPPLADGLEELDTGPPPNQAGKTILEYAIKEKAKLENGTDLSEIYTDRLVAGLEIVTPHVLTDVLTANTVEAETITAKTIRADSIEGLEIFTDKVSSLEEKYAGLKTLAESPPPPADSGTSTEDPPVSSGADSEDLAVDTLAVRLDARMLGKLAAEGGLIVGSDAEFQGETFFRKLATFFGSVLFRGEVEFEKAPTFGNNTAGFAVIAEGERSVDIVFDEEYGSQPIVTATITSDVNPLTEEADIDEDLAKDIRSVEREFVKTYFDDNVRYIVTKKSKSGFTIALSKDAPHDLQFSWMALAVKESKTFYSKGSEDADEELSAEEPASTTTLDPGVSDQEPGQVIDAIEPDSGVTGSQTVDTEDVLNPEPLRTEQSVESVE